MLSLIMMSIINKADILELSVSERIQLVEDIWDSISEKPESIPLTKEHKKELDTRLESYKNNPNLGTSWESVKKKLENGE